MSGKELAQRNVTPLEIKSVSTAVAASGNASQDEVKKWMRIGLALLVFGFGGFFVWAATAPLQQGVPVPGVVSMEGKRQAVDNVIDGVVRRVFVAQAQLVKKGEVLVKLDDTQARAAFEFARQTYFSRLATEDRLLAEQRGATRIKFDPELLKPENAAAAGQFVAVERTLFATRRNALAGDIGIINESAAGQEEVVKGLKAQLANKKLQLALVQEQLDGTRDLVKEGYLPRNTQLEQERLVAALNANISEIQGNIAQSVKQISELKLRATQQREVYQRGVVTQLAEVRREVATGAERLKSAREGLKFTVIRSPARGQVVGLSVPGPGGVLRAGQHLMDIVPKGAPLVIHAIVPPRLIDKVHAGLKANIDFHGFVDNKYASAQGEVISVSRDVITEPLVAGSRPLPPHYLVRLKLTPKGKKQIFGEDMQPGMIADVVIITGQRTMLTYLLRPLMMRLAVSMKEH